MNKFIILIGSYNNEPWVENNVGSVMMQDYTDYKVIYFNDASTDNTLKNVKNKIAGDSRFTIHSVTDRKYKTWFFHKIGSEMYPIDNDDILVFLDGDDMLSSENVLSYLDEVYNKTKCWLTYGGMQVWDGNSLIEPFPQNSEIPPQVIEKKLYRQDLWRTSHLKTMRGLLWNKFNREDLLPNKIFEPCQDDLAIMFAMLELCPPSKVHRVIDPVYIYNTSHTNGGSRGCTELKTKSHLETIIRNYKPYGTLALELSHLLIDVFDSIKN